LEIENCLFAHPGISSVSVVGVPDERYGEVVAAFVVAQEHEKRITVDEIKGWVREKLSHHLGKILESISFGLVVHDKPLRRTGTSFQIPSVQFELRHRCSLCLSRMHLTSGLRRLNVEAVRRWFYRGFAVFPIHVHVHIHHTRSQSSQSTLSRSQIHLFPFPCRNFGIKALHVRSSVPRLRVWPYCFFLVPAFLAFPNTQWPNPGAALTTPVRIWARDVRCDPKPQKLRLLVSLPRRLCIC
jgi:hypothetical protein